MGEPIDVQVEEARKLAAIQHYINNKYAYRAKSPQSVSAMVSEMKGLCEDAGFIVEFNPLTWQPTIIGRTDKRLERQLKESGPDLEQKIWDSQHITSEELRRQGVNPELLG